MKRFAQIYNEKAHWIFETEEKPEFAPDIILIDITDSKYNNVREGWNYNKETGVFSEPIKPDPVTPEPTLEEMTEETLLETKYQTTLLELNQ